MKAGRVCRGRGGTGANVHLVLPSRSRLSVPVASANSGSPAKESADTCDWGSRVHENVGVSAIGGRGFTRRWADTCDWGSRVHEDVGGYLRLGVAGSRGCGHFRDWGSRVHEDVGVSAIALGQQIGLL